MIVGPSEVLWNKHWTVQEHYNLLQPRVAEVFGYHKNNAYILDYRCISGLQSNLSIHSLVPRKGTLL